VGQHEMADRKSGPGLLRLWIVVSGLWTAATLLRIGRVWVPVEGWQGAVRGPWIWMSLIIPPSMFAAVAVAIHLMCKTPRK
jgi:hypothetical protein